MDKVKLKELAIKLEQAIDAAYTEGTTEALDFKPYVADQIAAAKAMKIDAPIEFNTHGAWRWWFSETALGGCDEIQLLFSRFSDLLKGREKDALTERVEKRMREIQRELFPPKE